MQALKKFYFWKQKLKPFISTWKTDNTQPGSSGNNQIKLPLLNGGSYRFSVQWGDGTSDFITSWDQPQCTHTYSTIGTYTVIISGTIKGWAFSYVGDMLKILEIKNWGNFRLLPISNQVFGGCYNLKLDNVQDVLNFDGCSSFIRPFQDISGLTKIKNIEKWDVSKINTLSYVIYNNANLVFDISDWKISSAINLTNFIEGGSPLFSENLDSIYNKWINNKMNPNLTVKFGLTKYSTASIESRALLTRPSLTKAVTNAVDTGSAIRLTVLGHGLSNGNKVFLESLGGVLNSIKAYSVFVVDINTIDLIDSVFVGQYTSGGIVRTGYGWIITDGGLI